MYLLHWGVRFTLIKVAFFSLSERKMKVCDVLFKKSFFPQTNISFKVILNHYISVIEWISKTTFMICTCNVIFCLCFIHFTSPPRQVLPWLLTYLPLFYVIFCHYQYISASVKLPNYNILINVFIWCTCMSAVCAQSSYVYQLIHLYCTVVSN